jgi:hypothetical protein
VVGFRYMFKRFDDDNEIRRERRGIQHMICFYYTWNKPHATVQTRTPSNRVTWVSRDTVFLVYPARLRRLELVITLYGRVANTLYMEESQTHSFSYVI